MPLDEDGTCITTVQIQLPDQLARDAQAAGLLSQSRLEPWLREQLRARRVDELFEAMDRMTAVDEPPVMTPEEVAVIRAERSARGAN